MGLIAEDVRINGSSPRVVFNKKLGSLFNVLRVDVHVHLSIQSYIVISLNARLCCDNYI